ncbi:MAG: hypothetical protein ACLQIQ_11930 [Beijerinckiaceae bacterium]
MEQKPFDVVLLDLRMPGRDSLSLLRTIEQKWRPVARRSSGEEWAR